MLGGLDSDFQTGSRMDEVSAVDTYMTDWERSARDASLRARVQLALFLAGAAAGLGGGYMLLVFAALSHPALRPFVDDPRWDHFLGGPTVVANVLAALLLIGCRPERPWRARSLLLLAASAAGLGFWVVEHSHFFGWNRQVHHGAYDPFTVLCVRSIGLVRIVTLADLAAVVATMSGSRESTRLRNAAVGTAMLAFVLWLVLAVTHIDWGAQPLQWRNIRDPHSFGLLAGSIFARAVSAVLAAILCGSAVMTSRGQGKEKMAEGEDGWMNP